VSSTTGLVFSYVIGLTFLVGGIIFLLFLDENRFTFGIPYLLLGLTIVYGMYSGRKRKKRREAREAAALADRAEV
jgi:Ca2+/Na+ antiporter